MEEQVGALLQSAPQVVKRVLRGLSGREVQRAARVCRTWRKYAAIVLKERRRVLTMTGTKENQQDTLVPIVNNPETKQFLRDMDMECGLTIMFHGVASRFTSSLCTNADADDSERFKAMRSCLSPSSAVIGATCSSGIIGTSTDGCCHEQQSPTFDCLGALLVPKSLPEGTQIKHFSLSLDRAKRLVKTEFNKATFAQAFDWPKDEVLKCIILLAAEFVPGQVDRKLISTIRTVHDGQVALAGGIADEVYSSTYGKEEHSDDDEDSGNDDDIDFLSDRPAYVGLMFGGENVRAASLVVGQLEQTKEAVEKRLKELKATVDAWGECKQKLGFMFACCGRGQELFATVDVETGLFKELMPDVLVNGMFSMGEFGYDFPVSTEQQPAKKPKRSHDVVLSYTTTFAVVGFV